MQPRELTEAEKERAQELAHELERKIAQYFPEPPQDERIAELKALRTELEDMGFVVTWSLGLDSATFAATATVTLYLPKNIH